jgi:Fe-S-cluster containining protein
MLDEDFNQTMAVACQDCGAACCKKGMIFLPREEYERIKHYTASLGSTHQMEFIARTSDHGSYLLYDQKNGCQFLDDNNLCRLHENGLKPSECFWWPYHVFVDEADGLEVRLSTSCCDAHKVHHTNSPHLKMIEAAANHIGFDVIREFRRMYGSIQMTQLVGPIHERTQRDESLSATEAT